MSRLTFLRNSPSLPGRWMPAGGITATALGTGVPTANALRASPIIGARGGMTINKIAICQQSVTAGNARMGLYRNTADTDPYPGALIVDAGAQACNAAQVYEWAVSVAVAENEIVWVAHVGDATPTMYVWNGGQMHRLGWPSTLGTLNYGCVLSAAYTYGALPANYPAGASVSTGTWLAKFYQTA